MAHLRKHPRSPYWYLRKRNQDSGKWEEETTGLRIDSPEATRKAQRLAQKHSVEEKSFSSSRSSPAFNLWVSEYIAAHYSTKSPNSLRRYSGAWQALGAFLKAEGLFYPRQIKYTHGRAYMRWRIGRKLFGRVAGHNTALLEIKFLSLLMGEAIKREFCETNPLAKLGIGRALQKLKPELSDLEIEKIWRALRNQPEWARTAFQIALHTGCRFSECQIPLGNIDFINWTMKLRDAKRSETDARKYFTVPVDSALRPTLVALRDSGAEITCSLSNDKNGRINKIFRKAGVNASFHSLRVTFITRLHRAGVSMPEAMRLANHSQQLVHRVYSRLNVEDVRLARSKVQLPNLR